MASVLYVTDAKMIDYHRLNQSKTMVFWRLSGRRFSRFHRGDLIFFLSRLIRYRQHSKGIVGYARYLGVTSMSVHALWVQYQDQTGYPDEESLRQSIRKAAKNGKLPRKIQVLRLDDVSFLNAPLPLEPFDMHVSTHLESYTYLEHENKDLTIPILEAIRKVGLDSWSSDQEADVTRIEEQILRCRLAQKTEGIVPKLNVKQRRIADQLCSNGWSYLNEPAGILVQKQGADYVLLLPVSNGRAQATLWLQAIGQAELINRQLTGQPVHIMGFYTEKKPEQQQTDWLDQMNYRVLVA